MAQTNNRRAFTLVELLVVIAIIGVLVALLLPAVQAAREAARRSQCANNLKQLGIAIHNYHDTFNWLPPGAVFHGGATTAPNGQPINHRGSIHIRLLPYIEQQPLYSMYDMNTGTDGQMLPNGRWLNGELVPTYVCPSDGRNRRTNANPNGVQAANYYPNMGPSSAISNSGSCSCPLYPTFQSFNRPGNNTDANRPAGPFTRNGWTYQSRLSEIEDGTSNTIFMGEVRSFCSGHVMAGWAHSNKWGGFTQIPINFDTCRTLAEATAAGMTPCNANCNWNAEVGFKSLHPGGAQFVLGDGSVRFIPQTVNMTVYNYLGDKADKQATQLP
jgi:prepilin-type N-terminal cleavage/methylation domain-containing protein